MPHAYHCWHAVDKVYPDHHVYMMLEASHAGGRDTQC
jgi:hypothetical protein